MRPQLLLVLFVILQMLSCNTNDAEGLRFNLQKGRIYEYQTRFKVSQIEGDSLLSDVSNSYTLEVVEESGGNRTIKVTYKDFILYMKKDHTATDTSNKLKKEFSFMPQEMLNTIFFGMKDKSMLLKVNSMGKVTGVEGLTEIVKPIIDTMTLPPMAKTMSLQLMQSELGTKMITSVFSVGFDIYPNKPVKVGDSWEKDMQLSGMLPISTNTIFTVMAIDGNNITLDAKSLLTDNNRKGEVLSTYIVDGRTGLILDARINTKFGIPVMVTSDGVITGKEL